MSNLVRATAAISMILYRPNHKRVNLLTQIICCKQQAMDEYEVPEYLKKYREELITLLHKSQDTFERQLSYISAGSLALSIGFIKDVIQKISEAQHKWMLGTGWALLAATLLINCISHIRASDLHNRTIADINSGDYDPAKVTKRHKEIGSVNWVSVVTLMLGITSIIIFVTINIYK
jgi:hypothetical protein